MNSEYVAVEYEELAEARGMVLGLWSMIEASPAASPGRKSALERAIDTHARLDMLCASARPAIDPEAVRELRKYMVETGAKFEHVRMLAELIGVSALGGQALDTLLQSVEGEPETTGQADPDIIERVIRNRSQIYDQWRLSGSDDYRDPQWLVFQLSERICNQRREIARLYSERKQPAPGQAEALEALDVLREYDRLNDDNEWPCWYQRHSDALRVVGMDITSRAWRLNAETPEDKP